MKILLIQLRRLGDLILTTPAIVALRANFPQAYIALALTADGEPLLPALPALDETFILKRGVRDLIVSRRIRRGEFDCVIDFTRNDRSASLALLSGAPRRIVSDRLKKQSRLRARIYNELVPCAVKEMHTIDYNLALLQPLGISGAATDLVLDLPRQASEAAAAMVERDIGSRPFVIFHPGSTRPEKFWEPDRWAEVIAFAQHELHLAVAATSGSSALEREHVAAILSHARVPVINLAARLDLLTLAALIARAQLLVTVDSAPMHFAAAAKTPQVVLFGPTNPFHWRPRGSPAATLCGPAREPLREFQPRTPKFAMNQISTATVIDAIRSVHTAPAASAV